MLLTLKTFPVFGKYLFVVSPGDEYPGDAIDEAEDDDDEAGDDESEVELVGLHKYVPCTEAAEAGVGACATDSAAGGKDCSRPADISILLTAYRHAVTPSSFLPAATRLPLCRIVNHNCPHNFGTATEVPTPRSPKTSQKHQKQAKNTQNQPRTPKTLLTHR